MITGNTVQMPRAPLWAAALLGLLCCWDAGAAAQAQCLASFREVKFPDGSARVKNYVCNTDGSGKPEIRIEFDRLSEAVAGSLIQGARDPGLQRAFGNVRVANNAVAAEARRLFDEYGSKTVTEECYAFLVNAAAKGTGTCGRRTLWYLTYPEAIAVNMPLISDIKRYQDSDSWPEGYNFLYGSYCDVEIDIDKTVFDPFGCTTIWRSARARDVANYVENAITYEKMLGFEPSEQSLAYYNQTLKYFALVDDISGGAWPTNFLVISGEYSECSGIEYSLRIRRLLLDVAFIQNISDRPLTISDMIGAEGGGFNLREALPQRSAMNIIALAPERLAPGETVAVPLGMTFTMDSFGDQKVADKVYKRIRAARPGTVFHQAYDGPIRKVRESFGPPKAFKASPYAYGPELQLSGLVVDDQPIVFDRASRNFMKLTATAGVGSCPYLHSWDDRDETWVHHGKVIHAAIGADKEMTERKTFEGFRAKFRLAEEELEVSYIDSVALEVELHNGTGMTLKPDFESMAEDDGHYATIKAGDRIEFGFHLPAEIEPKDVERSTLAITGYYRRYSDLLMARQ